MRVAEDLLGAYQHKIDGLTLTPGPKGIFDVAVNGEIIFSKHAAGRHADPGEVLETFTALVSPGVATYGS